MYWTIHRYLVLWGLLTCLALGQTSSPAAKATPPAEDENARKARVLINQAIEALGGAAYLTYQSRSEEGRFYTFFHGESNSLGSPFAWIGKYPDKDRLDIVGHGTYVVPIPLVGVIGVSHQVKNKNDIIIIHNGDKGYEVTYKGTAAEKPADTADFIRRRKHSLDVALREWVNEPTIALFYLGVAVAENKAADQIQILNARNDSITLFLDQTTHLPIKTSYFWRDPSDKMRNVEEEVYDNYKPVQGVMTPHSVTRYLNGDMSHQRFLTHVSYETSVPDSLFEASLSSDLKKSQHQAHPLLLR